MAGESIDLFQNIMNSEIPLASQIVSYWTRWYAAKIAHMSRMKELRQFLYATSTRETSNAGNDHQHSTNLPKITQIYDNLKGNYMTGLMPGKRWFVFDGEDNQAQTKETRTNIESYLRTKHRQSKFRTKMSELVDDWLIEGNCFAAVVYKNSKHTTPAGEKLSGYSGPDIVRIAPNDIVFNIAASSFQSSPKIVRTVKTMGELARDLEENPDAGYYTEILARAAEFRMVARGMQVEDINKYSQVTPDGFGSLYMYLQSGYVEILDFYGDLYDISTNTFYKNHVITVIDRKWVIRNQTIDTYKGSPMIFHSGWRKRQDNLWAMGPLENLVGIQYKINHLENQKSDIFDAIAKPDRVIVGDVDEEVIQEDGTIHYYINSAQGSVQVIHPDTTVLNSDMQIKELEAKMELYAGAPSEAMGVRTPGEKTKFEVGTLENSRGRLFQFKMTEFESEFLEDILNSQIELARRYLGSGLDKIRIEDDKTGIKIFQDVGVDDLTANGRIIAQGASHYARQAQLSQNLQMLSNISAQDKELQQHFPAVKLAQAWESLLEFEEFDLIELYGRIAERLQAQRLIQVASTKLQQESATPTGDNPAEEATEQAGAQPGVPMQ